MCNYLFKPNPIAIAMSFGKKGRHFIFYWQLLQISVVIILPSSLLHCSLRMYNTLVERCFTDCVDTFRRKTLDKQEETCVRRCAEKFLKHSMRVGLRFAELNQGAATPD